MAINFYDNTSEMPQNYNNIVDPLNPRVGGIDTSKKTCLVILGFDDGDCPTDEEVIKMNEIKKQHSTKL